MFDLSGGPRNVTQPPDPVGVVSNFKNHNIDSTIGGAGAIGGLTTRWRIGVLGADIDGVISQVDSVW